MKVELQELTEEELANNIPGVDNWGEIATDIIKLKMKPEYKNIELDVNSIIEAQGSDWER